MKKRPKVIVVMPAYRAERTIERAYREIPEGTADEVIVVDDASTDGTARVAAGLGVVLIVQPRNYGYGRTQKTSYAEALRRGADIVVMLHADAQYDARVIPEMVEIIRSGKADVVLGSRLKIPGHAQLGGMPFSKIIVNRYLTALQNRIFGTRLTDMHTGFRAYNRKCLETLQMDRNSDNFLFDCQFLAQAAANGFHVEEVPVESRYFAEASSIGNVNGIIYTVCALFVTFRYLLNTWTPIKYPLLRPATKKTS